VKPVVWRTFIVPGLMTWGKVHRVVQAVLTGVETRTSSPLRVRRDETYQSVNVQGLYPAGEGAGYAGGIYSAAIDGIEVAEAVALNMMVQYPAVQASAAAK
jgi:uncharacterized FAD-dependent dehydrogenase